MIKCYKDKNDLKFIEVDFSTIVANDNVSGNFYSVLNSSCNDIISELYIKQYCIEYVPK